MLYMLKTHPGVKIEANYQTYGAWKRTPAGLNEPLYDLYDKNAHGYGVHFIRTDYNTWMPEEEFESLYTLDKAAAEFEPDCKMW